MGNSVEEIWRDFDEIKKMFYTLVDLRILLKGLVKQKGPKVVELEAVSFSHSRIPIHHGPTPVDIHSTNYKDKLSEAFKKFELPYYYKNDPIRQLARAKKFFKIQNIKLELKIFLDFVCTQCTGLGI